VVLQGDTAIMLTDDLAANGQAQATSASLVGYVRLKGPLQYCLGKAFAMIADIDL
jgi:hypothetical protein